MALTKARLLKRDFPVHGMRRTPTGYHAQKVSLWAAFPFLILGGVVLERCFFALFCRWLESSRGNTIMGNRTESL